MTANDVTIVYVGTSWVGQDGAEGSQAMFCVRSFNSCCFYHCCYRMVVLRLRRPDVHLYV